MAADDSIDRLIGLIEESGFRIEKALGYIRDLQTGRALPKDDVQRGEMISAMQRRIDALEKDLREIHEDLESLRKPQDRA
jgi:predicted RNase H-like nuclease (RuvC/YqgF family)